VKNEPKSRVVSFRLSEAEYAHLKSACGMDDNSVSAVTRDTVLAWAEAEPARPRVEQYLAEINSRLDALCKLLSKRRHE
jgi:hypothetical protein